MTVRVSFFLFMWLLSPLGLALLLLLLDESLVMVELPFSADRGQLLTF